MEKEIEKQKPKEIKEAYSLVEVPTGSALAIQKANGDVMNQELALVEILNKLERIEKAVA